MSRLEIRDAHAREAGAIEAVTLSAYGEYAAVMSTHWEVYRQNILAVLAAAQPTTQVVAVQDGNIVGSVLLYPAGTVIANPSGDPVTLTWPEVRLLAVAPAARGQGLGAVLMRECVRRARHSGAKALTLHTADLMQAAMRLYERMGFQRSPELDFEPVPGVTIKGFRLRLDEAGS